MGDLKVSEGFLDAVMIRVTSTGLAALGLSPTCTLTRLSTGTRTALTVAEITNGIYKVTDMTPLADDEYMTEWTVSGSYVIYSAYKLFKVGGGRTEDNFDLLTTAALIFGPQFTATASSTTTLTDASLLDVASNYLYQMAVPLAGNMLSQGRLITGYNGTNQITVTPAWAEDPGSVDFVIQPTALSHLYDILIGANGIPTWLAAAVPGNNVSMHEVIRSIFDDTNELQTDWVNGGRLDSLIDDIISKVDVIDAFHDVPGADVTTNAQMSDVIGNKTDAAVQDADATQKSIIALIKGLHDMMFDDAGIVAWPAGVAPGNGVSFAEALREVYDDLVVVDGFHDVPGQDVVTNAQMSDVIGNKTDTPVQDADATQKSIIALAKGILDILWDDAGIVAWAAAAAPANGTSISEAIRYIVENQLGAEFDGTPNIYDVEVTGYTGAATSTPVGSILERLQLLQEMLAAANTKFLTTAATVNTVTCAALVDGANFYEKMLLLPLNGDLAGHARVIDSYDGTAVLTVVPDWPADPDAGGAFNFVIKPVPTGFLYEAGKGLSAIYDLVDGIVTLSRVYSDYDIAAEDVEETIFEYDDIVGYMHPEWLEWHLDEMLAGDTIRVKAYVKDNDTDDNERCIFDQSYGGIQAVPVQYIQLPPTDLYFKATVEQVDIDTALIDVLFKLYKKS